MKPKTTIRTRIFIFYVIWLLICASAFSMQNYLTLKSTMLNDAKGRLETIEAQVHEQIKVFLYSGDVATVESLLHELVLENDVLEVIVTYNGLSIRGNDNTPQKPFKKRRDGNEGISEVSHSQRRALHLQRFTDIAPESRTEAPLATLKRTNNPAQVDIFLSTEPIYSKLNTSLKNSGYFVGLLLLGSIGIAWIFSCQTTSPLKKLAEKASNLSQISPSVAKTELDIIGASLASLKTSLDSAATAFSVEKIETDNLTIRTHHLEQHLKKKNDQLMQVSHDLKTPISALSGHIENLDEGIHGPLSHEQQDRINRIKALCDRVLGLTKTLLNTTVQDSAENIRHIPKRKNVELITCIRDAAIALDPLLKQHHVSCKLNESVLEKQIHADPQDIFRLFLNLIHNAIKASPEGATIEIDAKTTGKYIESMVIDSGRGIPSAIRPYLFKQIIVNDEPGSSGAGLYICNILVKQNGGQIEALSSEAGGATFKVLLPRAQEISTV